MARTTAAALILIALALAACGRKGPLEAPGGTPQGVEKPATPEPKEEPGEKPGRVLETPAAP